MHTFSCSPQCIITKFPHSKLLTESISANAMSVWALCFSLNSVFMFRSSMQTKFWKVYSGSTLGSEHSQRHSVEKIIVNEKYNHQTLDNDIALIKLQEKITFTGQSQAEIFKWIFKFIFLSCLKVQADFVLTSAPTLPWCKFETTNYDSVKVNSVLLVWTMWHESNI